MKDSIYHEDRLIFNDKAFQAKYDAKHEKHCNIPLPTCDCHGYQIGQLCGESCPIFQEAFEFDEKDECPIFAEIVEAIREKNIKG